MFKRERTCAELIAEGEIEGRGVGVVVAREDSEGRKKKRENPDEKIKKKT